MTFLRDIASAPLARLTVTIIGSISGVRPTATATANKQRFEPIALGQAVDHEDKRGHHHDETEHQPGKPGDALVEAREHPLLGNFTRHKAEGGARAGEHDDAAADAADDGAAHEADVGEIKRRFRGSGMGGSDLLERHRLAGECRLVEEEILRRDQPEVGGDHVARRQQDDVAGHELLDRHVDVIMRLGACLPAHGRGYRHHPLQLVGGIVGTMLLDEAQRDAQNHHDGDHDRGPLIAQEVGRGRKREQKQVQRVDRAADKLAENCMARLMSDLIQSRRTEPLPRPASGVRPAAVLESRCNASSGERQAISPKAFPLAADPSGALAAWRPPRARMGVIAIGLFTIEIVFLEQRFQFTHGCLARHRRYGTRHILIRCAFEKSIHD